MRTITECVECVSKIKDRAIEHGGNEMFLELADVEAWLRYLQALEKAGMTPDLDAAK